MNYTSWIIFLQCLAVVVAGNLNFNALNPLPELIRFFAPRERVIIHWPPVRVAKKLRQPVYLPGNSKIVNPFKVFELKTEGGKPENNGAQKELFTINNGKLVPVSIGSFLSKSKGLNAHYLSTEHQKQKLEIDSTPPSELVADVVHETASPVTSHHEENSHLSTHTFTAGDTPMVAESWRPMSNDDNMHMFKINVPDTADEVNLQPLNHHMIEQQSNTIDDREKEKEKAIWVLEGKQWKKMSQNDKDLEEIRANFKNQNAPLTKAKQILQQTIDDYNVKAYLLPTAHRSRSNDADTAIAGSKQNYQLLKAIKEFAPKANKTVSAPITSFAGLQIDPKELIARAKKQQELEKRQPEKPSTQKKDLTTQPGMAVAKPLNAKQAINNYINHKLKMATAAMITSTHRPRVSTVFPVYSSGNVTALPVATSVTATKTTKTTAAPPTAVPSTSTVRK